MRVVYLDLLAFGAFSNVRLSLDGGAGVVDLVYGANEAGKSTTLRAISGLLFGIPERTPDAHRHAPSELRIGAMLEAGSGRRIEIVRRKGRKNTLRSPNDAPVDEAVLGPLLQGASRELFEGLFGLDHERLRTSAEDLLAGKGNVGESLFTAGVGARGVHELATRLAREAEDLFRARGREQKVTKAISEVREAREGVRNAATSPSKYLEQQRGLEQAMKGLDALRARRTEIAAEQARLQRIVTVLPGLRRRAELIERLGRLGAVVELPHDSAERRLRALHDLEEARRDEARAFEQAEETVRRLSALVVPEPLLDVDEAVIADLRDRRGRHSAAQRDRPGLEAKAVAIETAVAKSLRTLGASTSMDTLNLSVAAAARIRGLATKRQRFEDKLEAARGAFGEARTRRRNLLSRLLSRVTPDDRARVEIALDGETIVGAPADAVVERFQVEKAALEAELSRLAAEAERVLREQRDIERRLGALFRLGDVPSESDLRDGRRARDAIWERQVRGAAQGGGSVAPADIDAYESAVASADAVADRLRREADRVALLSTLEADRDAISVEMRTVEGATARAAEKERAFDERWTSEWRAIGLTPKSPAEMRAWVVDFDAARGLHAEIERFEGESEQSSKDLEAWKEAWSGAVEVLGLTEDATEEEAFAVLDAMTQLVRQIEQANGLRQRVDGIVRDAARFAEDVRQHSSAHLPEAVDLPAAEAAERFIRAVEHARTARTERVRLEAELVGLRSTLADHAASRRDAEERLSALLALATVSTVVLLEDAERRSFEARSLRDQIRAVEDELFAAGDGVPLDVLDAETRGEDLDHARARLRDLDNELDELGERMSLGGQEIGHLDHGIDSMKNTNATEAAAFLEDRVGCLKRHVQRYVRVHLASVLLTREIERYRQENQGPIVARASELFPRLTVGRYSGLRVGFDASDQAVLLAVRADGNAVGVDALSDGTRDQLYLALRLASLERHARANEPMPLVLDDVLIHSDDDRARAALDVLGEVARTTQVLFFTHHARLVELARAALGPDRLAVHTLTSDEP